MTGRRRKSPAAKTRPASPILAVRGLSVQRGPAVILDHIDWQVDPGQHWVILGPNGSGKTSLLAALTAYLTFSAGSIEVLGETYGRTDWRELRRRVGLVSSGMPQMIGDDVNTLDVVLGGLDPSLNRAKAAQILRRVEATAIAERPWGVLSQGERQRVLIGRALLADPPLLILDEPCTGLDPVARERFMRFLDRLGRRRGGPSLVLVTHHVEEIAPVFTHALLLRGGRVVAAGEKTPILTSPRLSQTFGAELRVARRKDGRYRLTLVPSSD